MKKLNFFKLFFIVTGLTFVFACSNAQKKDGLKTIDPKEFSQKIKANKGAFILDVRTPEEYVGGHLQNAKNVNWYSENFNEMVIKADKNKPVYVYCQVGGRSLKASNRLIELGFKEVYNLNGGMSAWMENKLEVVK